MGKYISSALLLFVLATTALGQCAATGLTLALAGGRLGDPASLTLTGTPGAPGLLGIDVSAGPSATTPIGTLCLGLTPAMVVLPFTLDNSGQFSASALLPPQPALTGQSLYLQAAAYDPTQQGGVAISNGATLKFRPPRIFFIEPGYSSPFSGTQPGSWCTYNALTDVVILGPVLLPTPVVTAVRATSFGCLAFLFVDGSVGFYDQDTGALMFTIFLPPDANGMLPVTMAIEGNVMYACYAGVSSGKGWATSIPGTFTAWSLPSGANIYWTQLTGGNPQDLLIVPGSGFAYMRDPYRYAPIPSLVGPPILVANLATGAEQPPIFLGPSATRVERWLLEGSTLYCVHQPIGLFGSPPFISAINTTTNLPVFPAPVTLPLVGQVTRLCFAPGTFGNSLYVYALNNPSQILELNPTSLQPGNSVSVSSGIDQMTLSPGGTELLLLCYSSVYSALGLGCAIPDLQRVTVPNPALSSVTPLIAPMQHVLVSLPSATLRRAFIVYNWNVVLPFSTDPGAPPTTAVTLPMFPTALLTLVD